MITGVMLVGPKPVEAAMKKWQIGLKISPIKIDAEEMTKKMKRSIGTGSYIVNAQSACADCHSCPTYAIGSNPFQGGDENLTRPTTWQEGPHLVGSSQRI
jgi:hypothetical protein